MIGKVIAFLSFIVFSLMSIAMEDIRINEMTIDYYESLSKEKKEYITNVIKKACVLAVDKNFELYMTYDKSAEPQGGSIPANMLTNAVIELTHKTYYPNNYEVKDVSFYREYYGSRDGIYKKILHYTKDELEVLLGQISRYAKDESFISMLIYSAWINLYPLRISSKL